MEEPNKNKESEDIMNLSPEQVLADFISRNQSENRHTRRMLKKMTGVKIIGTNKPYVKERKD